MSNHSNYNVNGPNKQSHKPIFCQKNSFSNDVIKVAVHELPPFGKKSKKAPNSGFSCAGPAGTRRPVIQRNEVTKNLVLIY